ncbi:MAG: hypothetical protein NVS2B16_03470 [Chloroflexota bacterium]
MSDDADGHQLDEARAIIAAQAERIAELEREGGLPDLRQLIQLARIADLTTGDVSYRALLDSIVRAAGRIFDAGAASIALLDQGTNELVFEAATGSGSTDIVGLRFPAHQGIAGWVVMTGEPIAVSDVRRDPRFARDFAESTGYIPSSILAVPLLVKEEVEGVLEVLDKANASSFGLDDMEMLTMFARSAALAVEQSRMARSVGNLVLRQLHHLAGERGKWALVNATDSALNSTVGVTNEATAIAEVIHTLSQRGGRTTQLALEILQAMARYTARS